MQSEENLGRWELLKHNVQSFWEKLSGKDFEVARRGVYRMIEKFSNKSQNEVKRDDIHIENYQYESHRMDDLPLTLSKDPGPGVKYSYTENSEFARGAEKEEAIGLDSFGEEDTFDPDEADEHQDFRNRNQNSDLSKRYFTHGLDSDRD